MKCTILFIFVAFATALAQYQEFHTDYSNYNDVRESNGVITITSSSSQSTHFQIYSYNSTHRCECANNGMYPSFRQRRQILNGPINCPIGCRLYHGSCAQMIQSGMERWSLITSFIKIERNFYSIIDTPRTIPQWWGRFFWCTIFWIIVTVMRREDIKLNGTRSFLLYFRLIHWAFGLYC